LLQLAERLRNVSEACRHHVYLGASFVNINCHFRKEALKGVDKAAYSEGITQWNTAGSEGANYSQISCSSFLVCRQCFRLSLEEEKPGNRADIRKDKTSIEGNALLLRTEVVKSLFGIYGSC